jgi:hypothetical protein
VFIRVQLCFLFCMIAEGVVEAFRLQADFCGKMGSPLYAELLARSADDIERGGPVARVFDGWIGNPIPDAVVLRFAGTAHRLALDGVVPELARHLPSAGGTPQWPAAWDAFIGVVESHADELRAALHRHVQTNEVRRSAALLGGFLTVAAAHGLPLRVLEIGSSAGLNLSWDRYRYELVPIDDAAPATAPRHVWGDVAAPVTIRTGWEGARDVFTAGAVVAERAGCDLTPIDVTDPQQVRMLESFIWPDQLERLAQLRAAIGLARRDPPPLTRCGAAAWLEQQLAAPRAGVATVLFHSIMWWYLSEAERDRVTALIAAAGGRATPSAPFAWLRLEMMTAIEPDLRLTVWPGGEERLLGRGDGHGRYVRWGSAAS